MWKPRTHPRRLQLQLRPHPRQMRPHSPQTLKPSKRTATSKLMACALDIKRLKKVFGQRKVLDKVTFSLPAGAFLSIFGPNGAGKSTLMRIIATLSRPSGGTVAVFGADSAQDPDAVRAHIGLISHSSMLYPELTALENLEFAARLYGVSDPTGRARELLKLVELDHRRFDTVKTFSRGMTQRLSIARALVHDPDLILLDEPYAGLDPHAVEVFDEIIASLREGRTFVMVSHDLEKGLSSCTHALVLARGKVASYQERADIDDAAFEREYREVVGMGVA